MSKRLSRVEMVTKRARWSECGGGGKSRMKVVTKARKRSKGGGQERKTASRHVRKRAVQSSTARYGEEKKAEKALWCWWARTEEGAAVKSEKRGRGRAWGMKRRRGRRGGASVDGWMDGWPGPGPGDGMAGSTRELSSLKPPNQAQSSPAARLLPRATINLATAGAKGSSLWCLPVVCLAGASHSQTDPFLPYLFTFLAQSDP